MYPSQHACVCVSQCVYGCQCACVQTTMCMCVLGHSEHTCARHSVHVRSEDNLWDSSSTTWVPGSNSDHQALHPAPFLNEPSRWPNARLWYVCYEALGIELRISARLGRRSTTELYFQASPEFCEMGVSWSLGWPQTPSAARSTLNF